jgi:flagellar biogenesis protein FliO
MNCGPTRTAGAKLARALAVACCFLMQIQAVAAQTLGGGAEDDISVWRIVGAFLVCVLLAGAGALVLRHRLGYAQLPRILGNQARRLRIVESLKLGRQITLSIVQCDERELLLLTSETAAQVVQEAPIKTSPDGAVPR